MEYVRVAIFRPVFTTYDYLAPAGTEKGARVWVKFANSQTMGIVWETGIENPHPKTQEILKLLDEKALFPPDLFNLIQFSERYYHYPLGLILESALPSLLRKNQALPILKPSKNKQNLEAIELTPAQKEALQQLPLDDFQVAVLAGITGSGKSEIYAQWIKKLFINYSENNNPDAEALEPILKFQILILVPEIGLTQPLFDLFNKRLNLTIAIYHSELSPKKRAEIWLGVQRGEIHLIIGTRSAVFLPFQGLRGIIVDEEHDLSYKQQEQFRYHARDLAVVRAKNLNIPIILGSATPSLEAYHHVQNGRWRWVALKERAMTQLTPRVVVDSFREGRIGALSVALIRQMRQTLADGQQILLFLNRRGFASVLHCPNCEWQNDCPNCSTMMYAHLQKRFLLCHHCGYRCAIPLSCPSCYHRQLDYWGLGTERLEKTVQEQFPYARVLRIDSDNYSTAKQFQQATEAVKKGEADIILGTQWLTKGHHFPNLHLVAVIDGDLRQSPLDYRQEERLGQLLLQVGGRAGREQSGIIWIQTKAHNQAIFSIFNHDYQEEAKRLYAERQEALLPPFSAQALFIAEDKNEQYAQEALHRLSQQSLPEGCYWYPVMPATLAKRAGIYRFHLLLNAPNKNKIQEALFYLRDNWMNQKVKIIVDIDPLTWD